jgi:hypothetical protein
MMGCNKWNAGCPTWHQRIELLTIHLLFKPYMLTFFTHVILLRLRVDFSGVARNRGTTWWIDNFAFLFRHWARDTCVESCSHHYSHSSWSWDLKELHDIGCCSALSLKPSKFVGWSTFGTWGVFKVRRIASSEVLHPPQDSIAVLREGSKGLYIRFGTLVK